MPDFDPKRDIPDLSRKVCLVTGGNSGLGEATLKALAQHNPGILYLGARSRAKAEAALSRIRATSPAAAAVDIRILDIDLASIDSVKAAAARLDSETDRLDVLQLNGGVGMVPKSVTEQGYEVHFGTNYLGHALLTQLLMPKLLATAALPGADVRVVAMASVGHKAFAPRTGIAWDGLKTPGTGQGAQELYGQAMLAKVLFALELARRYPRVTSSSLHPGTVRSETWNGEKGISSLLRHVVINPLVRLTGVSNDEGARTQLWLSFSPDVRNGGYYEPVGRDGRDGKFTRDVVLASKLWEWTRSELEAHGAPGWPACT